MRIRPQTVLAAACAAGNGKSSVTVPFKRLAGLVKKQKTKKKMRVLMLGTKAEMVHTKGTWEELMLCCALL